MKPVVIKYQEGSGSQPDTYKKCCVHRKEECVSFNEELGIAGRGGFMLDLAAGNGLVLVKNSVPCPKSRCDRHSLTQAGSCAPLRRHRVPLVGCGTTWQW